MIFEQSIYLVPFCFLAVDDIEEGKGVDEELELLPDAECELSEADKERAILAKEAAEQETEATEPTEAAEDESGMLHYALFSRRLLPVFLATFLNFNSLFNFHPILLKLCALES